MILKAQGVEVGSKNPLKKRSKNEIKMGRHLGIDFSWILVDVGGQVGTKLGSNIEKNRSKKALKNRCQKEDD